MGTLFLLISLLFAVAGNTSVKLSKGFQEWLASVSSFLLYGVCLYFLTLSVRYMDISIAYAIWSGVTIASTTLIGILFFQETISKGKIVSVVLIIMGVIIVKL